MVDPKFIINPGSFLVVLNRAAIDPFKEDYSIWVPKITIISPSRENLLFVEKGFLSRTDMSYYVKKGKGGGVWHSFEENREGLGIFNYYFVPRLHQIKENPLIPIYFMDDAFLPDPKDSDQGKGLVLILKGGSELSYFDLDLLSAHTHNPRSTANMIYSFMFSPGIKFGYDCEQPSPLVLTPTKTGQLEATLQQKQQATEAIIEDIGLKLF